MEAKFSHRAIPCVLLLSRLSTQLYGPILSTHWRKTSLPLLWQIPCARFQVRLCLPRFLEQRICLGCGVGTSRFFAISSQLWCSWVVRIYSCLCLPGVIEHEDQLAGHFTQHITTPLLQHAALQPSVGPSIIQTPLFFSFLHDHGDS